MSRPPATARVLVGVGALGWAALVVVATSGHGVGISPDSIDYLTTARSLSNFKGAVTWTGRPLVDYPPGYPALLAFVSKVTTLNPQGAARLVNIVLAAAVTVLAAIVLHKLVSREIVALLGTAAIVLSPSLLFVSLMAWTEFTFVLLQLVFVLVLDRAVRTRNWKWVVAAGLLGAAGVLTRYVGVTLLACGVVLLRGRQRVLFLAFGAVPVAAWLVRNQIQGGTPTGPRRAPRFSASDVAHQVVTELRRWVLPDQWPTLPQLAFAAVAVVAIAFVARSGAWSAAAAAARRPSVGGWPPLLSAVFVLGVGHFLLLGVGAVSDLEDVDQRLLAPLAVPAIVLAAVFIDRHLSTIGRRLGPRLALGVGAVAMVLFVAGPLAFDMNVVGDIRKHGYTYASDEWQQSPGMKLVDQVPANAMLYSNHFDGVFWVTGRRGANPPETDEDVAAMVRDARDRPAYVLWFEHPGNPYVLTPTQLGQRTPLTLIARTDDAELYQVVVPEASP